MYLLYLDDSGSPSDKDSTAIGATYELSVRRDVAAGTARRPDEGLRSWMSPTCHGWSPVRADSMCARGDQRWAACLGGLESTVTESKIPKHLVNTEGFSLYGR